MDNFEAKFGRPPPLAAVPGHVVLTTQAGVVVLLLLVLRPPFVLCDAAGDRVPGISALRVAATTGAVLGATWALHAGRVDCFAVVNAAARSR